MRVHFVTLTTALAFAVAACSAADLAPAEAPAQPAPTEPPPTQRPVAQPTEAPIEPTPGAAAPTETTPPAADAFQPGYVIVDSGQGSCYDNSGQQIACPAAGQALFGQDAQYAGVQPSYMDNGDGTVTDLKTGLMWQQTPADVKMTYEEALANAASFNLAGYTDWRLPTIKELYSLIQFNGTDASICESVATCAATPFIDTDYFGFEYGDTNAGERVIDVQYASSTRYVSLTQVNDETAFGLNLADGRIKGYGLIIQGQSKTFTVIYVRGNPTYGINDFADNADGTITDRATGLTWMQADSGSAMSWEQALSFCENLDLAGLIDWRLPNAKELHSIVDYTRSPDATNSAAIDSLFGVSAITDEGGSANYPFYWSSTSHRRVTGEGVDSVYIAFGEALGWMQDPTGSYELMDVHGAGAQRSDPKSGDPGDYPYGHGPQGDVIRIFNHARCVRDGAQLVEVTGTGADSAVDMSVVGSQPPGAGEAPAGGGAGQPAGGAPDLNAAAQQLGVTVQELQAALGPPPPDLAAAAQTLGVTEEALQSALGVP